MVITVKSLVPACDTNAQGDAVRVAIVRALQDSKTVDVSFAGFSAATTSFVNSAFVDLLDTMSINDIKTRIRIVHSSRQINDMIRSRLTREASLAAA